MLFFTVFLRTLFSYFFLLISLRLMGKREIGKLSVFDLVVSIMMAEIAVFIIEDPKMPILHGIIPIITILLTQIIISYITLKSDKIRKVVEGRPTILISQGKILDKEMAKERYTLDDLLLQLREKNILNIADVELAILETSGKLSVFPKYDKQPLTKEDIGLGKNHQEQRHIPLIIDGVVQEANLQSLGRNSIWLKTKLKKLGYKNLNKLYYVSIDQKGELYIDKKDD